MICTFGDLLLDVVARPSAGVAGGDDAPARIRVGPGGQAANVAAWACHLGATGRLVAARADDLAARLLTDELARRGVQVVGPTVAGLTGTVVALVDAAGERAMLSDRGVSPMLGADDLEAAWFAGIDRLHLTGYALMVEPIASAATGAATLARAAGARVSVDLSAAALIRATGSDVMLRRLDSLAPDLVFGTAEEFAALGGAVRAPVVVTKRGAAGCVVTWSGGREDVPAPDVAVVDSTGAGDAFAAGFLIGTTRDAAIAGAVAAAGACLGTMGAMPPSGEPRE